MARVVNDQRMILEKRNRKVEISKSELQKIIIQEEVKDTFLDEAMTQKKADEFIAWIKKEGPKPDWLEREYGPGSYRRANQTPASDPNVDRSAETMPLPTNDMPQYDDEYDEEGAYDAEAEAPEQMAGSDTMNVQDRIVNLVQDMQPEDMLDLFTSVIEKLAPEYIEPQRREIGFKEVKYIIQEVLKEVGDYHFGFGDEEKYNVLDPHEFDEMSDYELMAAMEIDGMEDMIVRDGEGGLVNRKEVIAALKNV